MKRLIRDPLIHFFVLGGLLFLGYSLATESRGVADGERVIVVDEAAILNFMQFRARAFNEEHFRKMLENMSAPERKLLIDDYVREEVLYREAVAMGLEEDDYMIRRRLVQKMEFIAESMAQQVVRLTEAEVKDYFEEHTRDYFVEPHVTFTHVFFDAERRGWEKARERAKSMLETLNTQRAPFEDAVTYTDRFPFHLNYVERVPDFVESHFGDEMAQALFALTPSNTHWGGPYESPYGAHLVLLISRAPGRVPEFDELRDRVFVDAEAAQKRAVLRKATSDVVDTYDVRIEYPMSP